MARKDQPGELPTVTQQLQDQIRRSGLNLVQLSEVSGVSPAQLSRFLNNKRGLNNVAIDRLCQALGLHLTKVRRPGKKRKEKGGDA
jgi:transcriptional regulator with XRE-family HTH domain